MGDRFDEMARGLCGCAWCKSQELREVCNAPAACRFDRIAAALRAECERGRREERERVAAYLRELCGHEDLLAADILRGEHAREAGDG